jgi:hypothetical protein
MDKIQALIESSKYADLVPTEAAMMKILLENAQKNFEQDLREGTLSGDVAQFTPILMPMVRRVYPNLIANEILGVQPMTMPTGYIYALTNRYTGTDYNKVSPTAGAKIYKTASAHGLSEGDTVEMGAVDGIVVHVEGLYVLVTTGSTALTVGADLGTSTVTEVYSNESTFYTILKNYTGTYSTAAAEQLGKDMKEIGFSIDKKTVEAKSRALKGQYSVELYQDLKSQHGLLADEEIMSLMSNEIQAEIDREIVGFVNANSTVVPDADFTNSGTDGSGRWAIEKYRTQGIKIAGEANQIGIDTKRGNGNILIVSPKVCTMLEQIGSFKVATQSSTVMNPVTGGGIAGIFDNRFKVIVDQYATSDYATVLYKGADRRDAMGFFAPYVPLSFTKVTHPDSGQPAIIAKMRYALDTIPGAISAASNDRAKTYARTFGIDFTNTILGTIGKTEPHIG